MFVSEGVIGLGGSFGIGNCGLSWSRTLAELANEVARSNKHIIELSVLGRRMRNLVTILDGNEDEN